MERTLPFRITVVDPPDGVTFRLQEGRDGLVPPARRTGGLLLDQTRESAVDDRHLGAHRAGRREPDALLEARIAGRAKDGGPACATVPLLDGGWRVSQR